MRSPHLRFFAALLGVAGALALRAASFDDRVATLFRPPLGEQIALSPDGRRVAYTTRSGRDQAIVILDLETPERKRTLKLVADSDRSPADADEPPPPPLRFLRWATAERLVYAPAERVVPLPPVTAPDGRSAPNPDGPTILAPIFVADADGKERGTLVDARDFQETPVEAVRSLADLLRTPQELASTRGGPLRWRMPHLDILGFHPRDREQLILTTRGAYSIPMQRLVDIRTGHIRDFGDDWPAPPGEPQIYDWFRLKVVGERPPAARPTTIWRDEDLGRVQRELAAKFPHRIVELLDWSDSRLRVLVRVTGGSDPGRVFLYQRTEDLVVEIFRHAPWLAAAQLHPTRWFAAAAPDGTPSGAYLTSPRPSRTQPPPLLVLLPLESPSRALPAFDPEAQVFAELGFAVARVHHRAAVSLLAADLSAWRTSLDRLAVDAAQPVLFLTAPGLSLAAEATPAELRRHLGRPVELVARDATFAATSPTTRATAYRQLGEHLQQRLNSFTSPTKPAEEVK